MAFPGVFLPRSSSFFLQEIRTCRRNGYSSTLFLALVGVSDNGDIGHFLKMEKSKVISTVIFPDNGRAAINGSLVVRGSRYQTE